MTKPPVWFTVPHDAVVKQPLKQTIHDYGDLHLKFADVAMWTRIRQGPNELVLLIFESPGGVSYEQHAKLLLKPGPWLSQLEEYTTTA